MRELWVCESRLIITDLELGWTWDDFKGDGKTCPEQNSPLNKPQIQRTGKSLETKFVFYAVKTTFSSSLTTGKGWKIFAQTTPAKLFQFSTGKTILQICQNTKMCEAMQTKAIPPGSKVLGPAQFCLFPEAQWSSLERALIALTL